jgi:multiple antibiotic resistance protein
MTETISFFILALVSLFTIINPFSTASVFHTISEGNTRAEKKYMAKKATITAIITLSLFTFLGSYILTFFGITLAAFKIAGGILILGVALKMIKGTGNRHLTTEKEEDHAIDKEDVSIIPLAIPMISGPGAMATVMVLKQEAEGNVALLSMIILAIITVCTTAYILLRNANAVDNYLGETGIKVTDKILGLIVLVIGVQFIINGLTTIITGWLQTI